MSYNNPENLPIVGEEDSHSKLKNEIKEEGRVAFHKDEVNPYSFGSTFWKWFRQGYSDECFLHLNTGRQAT